MTINRLNFHGNKNPIWSFIIFFLLFFVPFVLFNKIVFTIELPDYGSWTGIRPLEKKMSLLEEFTKEGNVDAVIFGSSIPDNGFSAQRLSELLTKYHGKPYRIFNFSTGSAEIRTYPKLLKLAKLYASPKTIFLTIALGPPSFLDREELSHLTPDYTLEKSPVGNYLGKMFLLRFSELIYRKTFLSGASALRDKLIFGDYRSRSPGYVDVTPMSKFGDLVHSNVLSEDIKSFDAYHKFFVNLYWNSYDEFLNLADDKKITRLLSADFVKTLREFIDQAREENIEIIFIPVDAFVGYISQSEKYKEYNRLRFSFLSKYFNTKMIYVLDDLNYDLIYGSDTMHGNRYAAKIFSERVFEKISGTKNNPSNVFAPKIRNLNSDLLIGSWKFAVLKSAGFKKGRLECQFLDGWQVPPHSKDLIFELISPENSVRKIPAILVNKTKYFIRIDFSDKVDRNEFYLLRIFEADHQELPASLPMSSCEWIND